jgi:putative FmdB family regulatory protein
MPIFEFACRECGSQFEELMSHAMMASRGAVCPDCGSPDVERRLSAFATGSGAADSTPACGGGGCGGAFT